jgi:hypothetical protein
MVKIWPATALQTPQRLAGVEAKAFLQKLRTRDLSPPPHVLPHTRDLRDVCWGVRLGSISSRFDRTLSVFQTPTSNSSLLWPRRRPPSHLNLLTPRVLVEPSTLQNNIADKDVLDVLDGRVALLYAGMTRQRRIGKH